MDFQSVVGHIHGFLILPAHGKPVCQVCQVVSISVERGAVPDGGIVGIGQLLQLFLSAR